MVFAGYGITDKKENYDDYDGLDVTGAHTLVTGQGIHMTGLAVDADHIYWTSSTDFSDGDGAVWAAGLDGTNPHIIVPALDFPLGMAVSAGHVYWASTPGTGGLGAIWEAGLDGSNPHIIVPGQNDPHGVAADASHLYWADQSTINEANLDGTNPQAIVEGQPSPEGVAVSPP